MYVFYMYQLNTIILIGGTYKKGRAIRHDPYAVMSYAPAAVSRSARFRSASSSSARTFLR